MPSASGGQAAGHDDKSFAISADVLIPGRGSAMENATVVIKEDKIAWVGASASVPAQYAGLGGRVHVPVLMPGLWDAHTHFEGTDVVVPSTGSAGPMFLPGAQALMGAVIAGDLEATLMAGFTSVREAGGLAGYIAPAIEAGAVVGPTVYSSIGVLSITGGHGDQHELPLSVVRDGCVSGGPRALCDGPDECTKMVRDMVRRGAKLIKVCSTGGVLSLNDQPEDTQFSPAELRAIVDEARRSGRVVAAHAIGKPGILAALEAGVKTIEHGSYLDQEVADLMKEKDAILCATRHIIESLAAEQDRLPPKIKAKLLRVLELSRESFKLAIRAGVKIALGTDVYSSDRTNALAHGTNARELYWAVQAGMTPLQAIEMGTATAPETLGPQAPKSGQIRAGYDADVIAVAKNPLDDIEILTRPSNITHVWKGGKLFKAPVG